MKDMAYFFKSQWTNEPLLHVFPHWNHAGHEGEIFTVYAYGNVDEAQLFVNGHSYGKQSVNENGFFEWNNVCYEPGELTATGYKNGRAILHETVRTTGAAKRILLKPVKTKLNIANDETAIINISMIDERGDIVPDCEQEILFTVSGAGEFWGAGNGDPGDHASDLRPARRAFHGLCQLHVQPTGKGIIKIKAEAAGIGIAECEVISE